MQHKLQNQNHPLLSEQSAKLSVGYQFAKSCWNMTI